MINVQVCSIKMLKYKLQNGMIDVNNTYCVISTSYPETTNFLSEFDTDKILVLIYDDISGFGSNSFNEELAQEIKDFVITLPSNADLYICCDEGVSRSSAIACATMNFLGQDEMKIWNDPHYHPNVFVYEVLCNVYGINVSNDRLAELQQISDNSLSNAINKSR